MCTAPLDAMHAFFWPCNGLQNGFPSSSSRQTYSLTHGDEDNRKTHTRKTLRSRRRRRQQLPEELVRRRGRGRLDDWIRRNVLPRAVLGDLPDLRFLN